MQEFRKVGHWLTKTHDTLHLIPSGAESGHNAA